MRRHDDPPRRARHPALLASLGVAGTMLGLAACGAPGGGSVDRIADDTVPYRLLESATPSTAAETPASPPGPVPVVVWLTDERLAPETTHESCEEQPEVLIGLLLTLLAAGPTEEARAAGRSSAIPPESGLRLVGLSGGTAQVEIEPEASLSAERLPAAVGQVVLTVTSAPGVRSVTLVSDGEPLQEPLPDGVLTDRPLTADDYVSLLPDRLRAPGSFGCPGP